MGANRDGTITALKVKTYANLGGILSTIAPGIPTTLYGRLLSGAYKIPHIYCNVIGTYTNTGMVDAYRGAGRPEATYVVERAVDLVARELNMDPVDVRRKNFVQPEDFPYAPADNILAGLKYDSGDYDKALDKGLEMVGYESFRAGTGAGSQRRDAIWESAFRLISKCAARRRPPGSELVPEVRVGAQPCGKARMCACISRAKSS